jgi:hypothetical protein
MKNSIIYLESLTWNVSYEIFLTSVIVRDISKRPPRKMGLVVTFIILLANVNGITLFESFLGPLAQY